MGLAHAAGHADVPVRLRAGGQLEVRDGADELLDGHAHLHPSHMRTEAPVNA